MAYLRAEEGRNTRAIQPVIESERGCVHTYGPYHPAAHPCRSVRPLSPHHFTLFSATRCLIFGLAAFKALRHFDEAGDSWKYYFSCLHPTPVSLGGSPSLFQVPHSKLTCIKGSIFCKVLPACTCRASTAWPASCSCCFSFCSRAFTSQSRSLAWEFWGFKMVGSGRTEDQTLSSGKSALLC